MTEWALPVDRQVEYEHLYHELEHDHRWPQLKRFFRGGYLAELQSEVSRSQRDVRADDDGQPP